MCEGMGNFVYEKFCLKREIQIGSSGCYNCCSVIVSVFVCISCWFLSFTRTKTYCCYLGLRQERQDRQAQLTNNMAVGSCQFVSKIFGLFLCLACCSFLQLETHKRLQFIYFLFDLFFLKFFVTSFFGSMLVFFLPHSLCFFALFLFSSFYQFDCRNGIFFNTLLLFLIVASPDNWGTKKCTNEKGAHNQEYG